MHETTGRPGESWAGSSAEGEPSKGRRPNEIEQEIRSLLLEQRDAWNAGDLEGFLNSGYWQSEEATFFSQGAWRRGFEDIAARYRAAYGERSETMGRLAFEDLVVTPLARDCAFVRGCYELEAASGEREGGIFTLVLRLLPEGWRIVHDHTSSACP